MQLNTVTSMIDKILALIFAYLLSKSFEIDEIKNSINLQSIIDHYFIIRSLTVYPNGGASEFRSKFRSKRSKFHFNSVLFILIWGNETTSICKTEPCCIKFHCFILLLVRFLFFKLLPVSYQNFSKSERLFYLSFFQTADRIFEGKFVKFCLFITPQKKKLTIFCQIHLSDQFA